MKRQKGALMRGVLITTAAFAALLLLGMSLLTRIDERSGMAETEYVRSAIKSAVLTCYAVEGVYPMSLDYLTENYGLKYDRDRYLVSYDAFASNLMPTITVLERGVDSQ